MGQIINIPGQGDVEFPDGMTDEQIVAAIQANSPKKQPSAIDVISSGAEIADKLSPLGMIRAANDIGGEFARKEGDFIGDKTLEATGSPLAATVASMSPDIANLIAGNRLAAIKTAAAPNNMLGRAAERIGYKPDLAQRSGNIDLNNLYDTLRNMPGSAGVIAKHEARNAKAINRAVAGDIGQNVDSITGDVLSNAKAELGAARDALKSQVDIAANSPAIIGSLQTQQQKLAQGLRSSSQFDNYANKITEALKSGNIKGDQYQQWRTDIRNLRDSAYKADRGNLGKAYDELLSSLDDAARQSAGPEWAANDKAFSALEMVKDGNIVNPVTGDVSQQLLTNAFFRKYGDAAKTGKLQGGIPDVATVTKGYKPRTEGSPTARREAYNSIVPWAMALPNYVGAKMLTAQPQDYARLLMYGQPVGGIADRLTPYVRDLASALMQGQSQ